MNQYIWFGWFFISFTCASNFPWLAAFISYLFGFCYLLYNCFTCQGNFPWLAGAALISYLFLLFFFYFHFLFIYFTCKSNFPWLAVAAFISYLLSPPSSFTQFVFPTNQHISFIFIIYIYQDSYSFLLLTYLSCSCSCSKKSRIYKINSPSKRQQ